MDQIDVESLVSLIERAVAKANGHLDERLSRIDRRIEEIEEVLKQLSRVSGVMDPTGEDEMTGPGRV